MSELSRSLVDAAAKYVEGAADVDYPTPVDQAMRAAVAAVLETLAAHERKHRFGYPLHDLRRLAAEVKSEEARP